MTFNPDTDANFALYNTTINKLDGYTRSQFDAFLVKYLCAQATTSITLNTAAFTTAVAVALSDAKTGVYTF